METSSRNDRELIEQCLAQYVEAAKNGRIDALQPIFHDLATICGYVGPDLFAGPIQMFYEWHAANGPAADLKAGQPVVDIEGTAATVRIELHDWTGHRFTDFFTLVKIDGRWKILSKMFHLHS